MIHYEGKYLVTIGYDFERTDDVPSFDEIKQAFKDMPEEIRDQILDCYTCDDVFISVVETNLELTED